MNKGNKIFGNVDIPVLLCTLLIMGLLIGFGIGMPDQFTNLWNFLNEWICVNFGWFYLLLVAVIIIFLIWLMFSKFGKVKLGKDDEKPEFTTFAWIAMLFSAGVGIGFIFWGVAEPILHFMETPYIAEPGTQDALRVSLAISTLHWGVHGWALFSLVGLAIGIAAFRLGKPVTLSGGMYGILGDKIHGPWGRVVDFFSALATIAGISTTLGLGVMSISFAAEYLFGMTNSLLLNVVIMVIMVSVLCISSFLGLAKGMKRLSSFSVYLAIAVMFLLLVIGPTRFILNSLVTNLGGYFALLPYMSFWTDPIDQTGWLNWWTVFYMGWWIAWTPFTAGFIAKISKGRTVKQFLGGVLLLPTILTVIWFSVMGGTSIFTELQFGGLYEAVAEASQSGLYVMLSHYPLSGLLTFVLALCMLTFIITSADASAFYCAAVMNKGSLEPAALMKVVMGAIIGLVALVLLQTGGLKSLQTMSIVFAFPFAFIILMCIPSLYNMLNKEYFTYYASDLEKAKAEELAADKAAKKSKAATAK